MRRLNQNVMEYLSEKALVRSTKKRVNDYLRTRFPKQGEEKKPVGKDKHVRDVMLRYAYNPEEVEAIEKHLKEVDYGPRQVAGSHESNLSFYAGEHAANFTWNRNLRRAVNAIIRHTKPRKPLAAQEFNSDAEIMDAIPREDTHAGFSYILTGMRKKGEYLNDIKRNLDKEEERAISLGSYERPLIIGERYQCSGGYDEDGTETDEVKYKQRTIHMYDVYEALTELRFSKEAQRHLGTLRMYAGGKTPDVLFQNVNRYRFQYSSWVSVDYSRYDQTIPGWLIEAAFRVVRSWFGDFTEKEQKLWSVIVNDFIHKGFVGPDGEIIYADDGVPSGSMFTQIIDTVCNYIMLETFALSQGIEWMVPCIICGDDNLIFHDGWFDVEVYASYIRHNFGIEIHPDKCSKGTKHDNPEFLSRYWTPTGIFRNPRVLVAKMMYPERYRDYERNEQLKPELIFYSFYLAYGEGMMSFFDIPRFLHDNNMLLRGLSEDALSHLSGFYAYLVRYEKLDLLRAA